MTTHTTPAYPDVPMPAGATKVYDWCDVGSRDAFRDFEGTSWTIADSDKEDDGKHEVVVVVGSQLTNGRVEGLHVKVFAADAELTASSARQLACAVMAAADELDRPITGDKGRAQHRARQAAPPLPPNAPPPRGTSGPRP